MIEVTQQGYGDPTLATKYKAWKWLMMVGVLSACEGGVPRRLFPICLALRVGSIAFDVCSQW